MFKKVISYPGFWRSVVSLALAFILLFILVKWAIEGFSAEFLAVQEPLQFIGGIVIAGLLYGFIVSFGKFRSKLKEKQP